MGCSYSYAPSSNVPYIKGVVGLRNPGSVCYLNSALQCLSNTPAFSEFLLSGNWKDDINDSNPLGKKGEYAEAVSALFKQIWKLSNRNNEATALKIRSILSKYHTFFRGTSPHDPHEALTILLDCIHEDISKVFFRTQTILYESDGTTNDDTAMSRESWRQYRINNRSAVVDIFHGQLKRVLKCTTCSSKSIRFDPFMHLIVPLPPPTVDFNEYDNYVDLGRCIDEFSKTETLVGENGWFCKKCNQCRDAEFSLEVWTPPAVLIIVLNRFYLDESGKYMKNETLVEFPAENFDLGPHIQKNIKNNWKKSYLYDLCAVSNHQGTLNSGHCTSFVKNRLSGKWFYMNDSVFQEVDASEVCSSSAYFLIYQRKSTLPSKASQATNGTSTRAGRKSVMKKFLNRGEDCMDTMRAEDSLFSRGSLSTRSGVSMGSNFPSVRSMVSIKIRENNDVLSFNGDSMATVSNTADTECSRPRSISRSDSQRSASSAGGASWTLDDHIISMNSSIRRDSFSFHRASDASSNGSGSSKSSHESRNIFQVLGISKSSKVVAGDFTAQEI